MDNNEYKISLGVKLDTSDLQSQIDTAGDRIKPIDIKVDAETKELTNTIKEALKSLSSGTKNALTLDTSKLEGSLKEVKDSVVDIRKALGSIDEANGIKSLTSSIGQISKVLETASNKIEELTTDLKSLSNKDFSISVGLDFGGMGKSSNPATYSRKAKTRVIPELKAQTEYLEKIIQESLLEEAKVAQATAKKINYPSGKNKTFNLLDRNFIETVRTTNPELESAYSKIFDKSVIGKMEGYEKYIEGLKKFASTKGIDLSGFNSQFSKSATDIIDDVTGVSKAVDITEDSTQKLKNIFGSGIDTEKLSSQLDSLVTDLTEIKNTLKDLSSGASLEGLTTSFDKLSNSIELLVKNCGNIKTAIDDGVGGANNGLDNVENDLKQVATTSENTANAIKETTNEVKKLNNTQIDIDVPNGDINELRNALKNMGVDDSSIDQTIKELSELNIVVKNVSATLKDNKVVKIDVKGVETTVDKLEQAVTVTTTFGKEGVETSKKYSQALDEVAIKAEKVHNKLKDTGANGFEQEVKRAHAEANRFEDATGDLTTALQRLDKAFKLINLADQTNDQKALVAAEKEYAESLKQVQSLIKLNEQNSNLALAKQKAQSELNGLFGKNSEAAKKLAVEINRIQKELNECGSTKGVRDLRNQMDNLKLVAKEAGYQTKTFGQRLKEQFSQYTDYLSVASVFMYVEQGLRDMFEQVVAIDSAMTELKKVTDETAESYDRFLTNAASRAKEIGTTVDGLVSSTADFARLGYGFKDSQGLAEVANIYAVVGDEIDGVETATQSLISTLTAFKNEANGLTDSDFAMSIVDKMNEVSNNFAISSGGIGEALQRSASSMMAANNSLDETIALITAANTVVQDPDVVGTAFKTKFLSKLSLCIEICI